jgi:hypothetical protein
VYLVERLGAMADLHHGHADAREIQHLALRLLQHRQRQHGGAGAEVKDSLSHIYALI